MVPRAHTIGTNAVSGVYQLGGSKTERQPRVMHRKLGRRGPISGHQCAANLGARARLLGADHGINYKTHPDWEREVLRLTAGRGSMW